MSHTPTSTGQPGNAPLAQTVQQDKKPSLTGVRIKQRKGQAKATAKFEPETFRDALLLHLALLPDPPTTDALTSKLVQAGSTLEFLKYYEQVFELLFVGGLLQPGGSYLDDKRSPVYIIKPEPSEDGTSNIENGGPKGIVEVLKKVIQRYKYLQKPLEENFLPDLLGYLHKYDTTQRNKLAEATALLIQDLQLSPKCLQSLAKDHVVKDNVGLEFLTFFMRIILANNKGNVEVLGSTLRRSGLKDIALVFPIQTRDRKHLEDHFKKEGLSQINEWYAKIAKGETKDQTVLAIEQMLNDEESNESIVEHLKAQQTDRSVAEPDMCEWIWQGLMNSNDWNARPDQMDAQIVQHVTAHASILESFCNGAKAEVALLNAAQVYCYADTRILKAFPQLVKVLYNADCVSDQAIIYWYQKGAKPQGKQHFLKAMESMVKFLEEQESDEE